MLKEQVTKKDKTENKQSEETLIDKNKKDEERRKKKFDEERTESTEDSTKSRLRTVNNRNTLQRPKKSIQRTEGKKKAVSSGELSKRLIEEGARKIERNLMYSPVDRALKAMKGISKSPFAT